MAKNTIWMVRAGESAYLVKEFESKNIVAIGWNELGDLNKITDISEIKSLVRKYYPASEGNIAISAGQINKFKSEFQKGDKILTYDPMSRIYLVGEILGDYEWNKEICEYHNIRRVKWLGKVSRDKLSTSTKNTLGAISTIFEINEDASSEILKLISAKSDEPSKEEEKADAELDIIKEDIKSKAREFIKDQISDLDWSEAQSLVAGILRGMGYKTKISPPGSDRGKDIIASTDGLGLVGTRIIVEVKHRDNQMGSKEIRNLIGVLRSGDKGIYVSTGGFSKDARYEGERAIVPIVLLDSEDLVDLITQYYDDFDAETRLLIPLTKIYWPEKS